jgi:hypothetical protein
MQAGIRLQVAIKIRVKTWFVSALRYSLLGVLQIAFHRRWQADDYASCGTEACRLPRVALFVSSRDGVRLLYHETSSNRR